MKKFTLFIILAITYSFSFSQNIELFYENELLLSNQEIYIEGSQNDNVVTLHGVEVINTSTVSMDILVKRVIIDFAEGSSSSFCWGICFPDFYTKSSKKITLKSLGACDGFKGNFYPNGIAGSSKILYVFYDKTNPDDSASIIVNYKASMSINIADKDGIKYSGAYPNPANSSVSFNYEFTELKNAQLVIFNFLGTTIRKINLKDQEGKIKVNTTEFDEGIYFYSLLIDNKTINTQKLIVNH